MNPLFINPDPLPPLGKKVLPEIQPVDPEKNWVPHKPGMEINTQTGQLRTVFPLPPPKPAYYQNKINNSFYKTENNKLFVLSKANGTWHQSAYRPSDLDKSDLFEKPHN